MKQSLSEPETASLDVLLAEHGLAGVHMDSELVHRFYDGFCNGIVWPLFHFLPMQLPLELSGISDFQAANQLFADKVAEVYRPGDLIWVQDFQLALVPQLLRTLLPKARIGFFLHIPFPSSEIFRVLPWRREFLEGMMGADVIGFHTALYANNFATCVLRILGVEPKVERIVWRGREVHFGTFPLGIDSKAFVGNSSGTIGGELAELRNRTQGSKILLGVDRLDYTKGIPHRLAAFEKMLEERAELRGKAILVQIVVPSSREVQAFEEIKRQVDELVGRINGRFGTPSYQPIHYIARSFSTKELVALYRAADVMVVTPLRDGMNLIAKEFCASRIDDDGVLVLSEFAGAASELSEALLVNPYDVVSMGRTYFEALAMARDERRQRMQALRQRLELLSNERWAHTFLTLLEKEPPRPLRSEPIAVDELIDLASTKTHPVVLILDYDGTVVPIAQLPELALPDAELLARIDDLSRHPNLHLVLLSGRSRDFIERWFGRYAKVTLFAEHGLWHRPAGEQEWRSLVDLTTPAHWKAQIRTVFDKACIEAPGSLVEEKSASLVWHYRMVEPELGKRKAQELRFQLVEALANLPLEVTTGKRIVEVRRSGVSKAAAVHAMRRRFGDQVTYVAIGDDETDEEMFRALSPNDYSVRVGGPSSGSRYFLPDVESVRQFLRGVYPQPGGPAPRSWEELKGAGP